MHLPAHLMMLQDAPRMRAFERAIRRTVRPGDRIVDLGCGTGILGFMALRAGASHVDAIDRGPVIETARRIARENGFEERMTFHRAESTKVRLRRRADVLITETLGDLGVGEGMRASIRDARRRLLRPGARIVPERVWICAEPVSAPGLFDRYYRRRRVAGFRYDAMWDRLQHCGFRVNGERPRPLGRAKRIVELDGPGPLEGTVAWEATGRLHGVVVSFEARLAAGVTLRSRRTDHWRAVFLPVAPARVRGRIELTLQVTGEDEIHWSGRAGGASFAHSSFLGGELP